MISHQHITSHDMIMRRLRRETTINTIANLSLIKAGERPTRGGKIGNKNASKNEKTKEGNPSIRFGKAGKGSKEGIFARLLRESKAGNEKATEMMERVNCPGGLIQ